MINVKVDNISSVTDLLILVYKLREFGLAQGTDFDYAYYPPQYETDLAYRQISSRHAIFSFHDEHAAMIFKLKFTN